MSIQKLEEAARIALICGLSLDEFCKEAKREMALAAVDLKRGNKSKAARELKIHRNRLADVLGGK